MMDGIRQFFHRLFCKHKYIWCRKIEPYHCISGERLYFVCQKCGKIKDTRFIKYD